MYFVYILQSLKDQRTYIGYTNDFERRFKDHNSGQSRATKYHAPFKLLFKEEFSNITEAKKRVVVEAALAEESSKNTSTA